MARKFDKISADVFNNIQFEAGVVLKNFNPSDPKTPSDEDIVCATTGGVSAKCVPTYSDYGADIDNCPNDTKELMEVEGWECSITFTALDITAETIKLSLGASDITSNKILPSMEIKDEHFTDIWWVGDISGGGFAAVKLENAISSDGFSLQTTKKEKGKLSVGLSGHFSLSNTKKVPMEFYVGAGA